MFSFIIYDQRTGFYGAARDHIGITSLYLGRGQDGSVWARGGVLSVLSSGAAAATPRGGGADAAGRWR